MFIIWDKIMAQLINTLLLSLLCVAVSTATWIPPLEVPRSQWDDIYPRYDILSTYKTCSDVHSGAATTKIIQLYKKTPATIVISGHGSGFFDVKFQDSLYTFDNKVRFLYVKTMLTVYSRLHSQMLSHV